MSRTEGTNATLATVPSHFRSGVVFAEVITRRGTSVEDTFSPALVRNR